MFGVCRKPKTQACTKDWLVRGEGGVLRAFGYNLDFCRQKKSTLFILCNHRPFYLFFFVFSSFQVRLSSLTDCCYISGERAFKITHQEMSSLQLGANCNLKRSFFNFFFIQVRGWTVFFLTGGVCYWELCCVSHNNNNNNDEAVRSRSAPPARP